MKVLITAGIGDFIALESVLRPDEHPTEIYWATRAETSLRLLVPFCFPNVVKQVTLFSAFTEPHTDLFCFASKEDLWRRANITLDPADIIDLSVAHIGKEYFDGKRTFHESALLRQPLADIRRFELPTAYGVIHPYSQNVRTELRDLDWNDWSVAVRFMLQRRLPIVILNAGPDPSPILGLRDLTNQTTLLEALEIVKGAQAFVGCSSALSVLAGQVVQPNAIMVKGHNLLRSTWQRFYYPKTPDCVLTSFVGA